MNDSTINDYDKLCKIGEGMFSNYILNIFKSVHKKVNKLH